MGGRFDPPTLRAAFWTIRSVRRVRRQLRRGRLSEVRVPAPPSLSDPAVRGVHAVLRRTSPTCLERALVLQSWLAVHGSPHEVVIGVTAPAGGFAAHAWLDGEDDARRYVELTRLSA
jgi:hypothetical protein